jgi:glycosyltransferase involved in cell wall biosynthesis
MPTITVFTPSHDPKFLDDCYESLRQQTFEDWEWVVLHNGPSAEDEDSAWTVDDPRVHIRFLKGTHGVGELKWWACNSAKSEYLVELDHDDVLAHTALERIVDAFESHPEAVFVYSDFAQINEDGSRNDDTFNLGMGWQYSEATVNGQSVLRCHSMHLYPSTVSYIWFAPNHVRAFRKDAYDAIGGYNPELEVLDDLDIIARLYQHGELYEIDECLYLQRVHPNNTQARSDLNERIQIETVQLYDQNVIPNALAWSQRNNLFAIDLGAAHNKYPGFLGVDQYAQPGVDVVADITHGLPFEDNSVGVIRASDFLEHIHDKVAIMNECYRVLAHGGLLLTTTPSSDGRGAYQDPTHVSYWNENSFWYYTDAQFSKYVPEIQCRFLRSRVISTYPSPWHEQHDISYVIANLVAVKDGPRIAGELLI